MVKIKWEIIYANRSEGVMDRTKVPGGWLVRNIHGLQSASAMTYYPDPQYKWKVDFLGYAHEVSLNKRD